MAFFAALLHSPRSTPLSRYIMWNGVLYFIYGALVMVWPGLLQLVGAAPFRAHEEGLVRVIGFFGVVVGWFYVMGARTRAESFGLATIVDRAIVPVVLVPLALTGAVDPVLALPIAVLDPLLAAGALIIWMRTRKAN